MYNSGDIAAYSEDRFQPHNKDAVLLARDAVPAALTDSLCLAGISIFTLKEVQLQRDPGYRNSSYPESGEEKEPSEAVCLH